MSAPDVAPELERYELAGAPAYRFELDRRELLKAMGAGAIVHPEHLRNQVARAG